MSAEEAYRLFEAANKVADWIFSHGSATVCSKGPWMLDRRERPPNPLRCQLDGGLCLELTIAKKLPSMIWTPWGRWEFAECGDGEWEKMLPQILSELGADLSNSWNVHGYDHYGRVFRVLRIGDIQLSPGYLRLANRQVPKEKALAQWESFARRRLREQQPGFLGARERSLFGRLVAFCGR